MSDEHERPLFSREESIENQKTKTELIEACASQESVLVVGAGLSSRLGYPTWSELLEKLYDLVVSIADEVNQPFAKPSYWDHNPLCYADSLRTHVQTCTNSLDRYHSFLRRTFNSRGSDLLHSQLVDLPFRGIVTTNYDPTLDYALASKEPAKAVDNHFVVDRDHAADVSEFVVGLRLRDSGRRRIAYLHGRFDSPQGIILTESDYKRQYDRRFDPSLRQQLMELAQKQGLDAAIEHVEQHLPDWTLHRKFLWTLLSTRRAVFLGFSMEDPYFTQMLRTVVYDLWRWDQPSHFAVMALSTGDDLAKEKARHFQSEYGVAVVFYENRDGRHTELESLIQEICAACSIAALQQPGPREETKQPFVAQSGMSAWMARINERTRRRAGFQ